VPTARSILRFGQPAPAEPGPPLVVADPNYDLHLTEPASDAAETPAKVGLLRQAGVRFNRLRGTRAEGERIAELLGVRPLLGAAALEEPMKAARSPQILHIATHGFFLAAHEQDLLAPGLRRLGGSVGDSALVRSGLALAGANTRLRGGALPPEAGDAILNGLDVAAMDLGATRLVVLSACETGLGELESGEGVFGLSRTFMQAGARTLVLSLWKVPDAQTQELMVDFYQQLLAGAPVSGALRAAQQRLKMRYPDPLYWAGFICQGDPGPITGQAP
ncbi:MAG TPA: CHAT domain-containing protein, partial [Herpetosiphonaceae bacterium]|nr:CHAT domain-containing protein [Herpetosiphonaceae bacterium]